MAQAKEKARKWSERPRSRLAADILKRRYLRKDEHGRVIETPKQMFRRVARAVAAAEKNYGASEAEIETLTERFYKLMVQGIFLPNSPTLMNAGRKAGMLSACFVLPVPDDLPGIFESVRNTALIQKAGGGTGFAFDSLRPTGDLVASSGGTTSGPISFMKVFSETTRAIQQGSFRRGANMAMMSLEHPDIVKFLQAKQEQGAFENFNLSAKVTDVFMRALGDRPNEPHVVVNPRTGARYFIPCDVDLATYTIDDLIPVGHVSMPVFTIRQIWDMLVRGAHATGEPGVCFIDRVNLFNPTPQLGRIEATNPCGEQPLLPYESCNLGSVNVSRFVRRSEGTLDWDALGEAIALAVRFLDDVIDVNHYPIPEIEELTKGNRKIGLGIMGFADALVLQGIRYDSEEGLRAAGELAAFLEKKAHEATCDLVEERSAFPKFLGSLWDEFEGRPARNATCTTIAPTGTISLIAECSSGIEPIHSLATRRRALDGREYVELHPLLAQLGEEEGWMTEQVRAALLGGVSAADIAGIPKPLARILVTAHEVAPEWHVRIQAAFQKHTDNAVSKTVNLPSTATVEDVDRIFRQAHELGCKGTTVYRDGSREGQTLTSAGAGHQARAVQISPRPRARGTSGKTLKFRMGCGTLFVTVNKDEQGLCEVFANLGKAGGCPSQSEATCRAVSVALRSGVDPKVLIEQLRGIRCLSTATARKGNGDIDVLSCPDAIARAIEEALGETSTGAPQAAASAGGRPCPHCGAPMRREAGCSVCDACTYNSCG
ncbi:MAG: adenosylcobalamin-dependent ribonucleoside-diphosphate reductase [Phycisphaerae bacterium]